MFGKHSNVVAFSLF